MSIHRFMSDSRYVTTDKYRISYMNINTASTYLQIVLRAGDITQYLGLLLNTYNESYWQALPGSEFLVSCGNGGACGTIQYTCEGDGITCSSYFNGAIAAAGNFEMTCVAPNGICEFECNSNTACESGVTIYCNEYDTCQSNGASENCEPINLITTGFTSESPTTSYPTADNPTTLNPTGSLTTAIPTSSNPTTTHPGTRSFYNNDTNHCNSHDSQSYFIKSHNIISNNSQRKSQLCFTK